MGIPTSSEYVERFVEAARCHDAEIVTLDHSVVMAQIGEGPRLAVMSGVHGDEPSGPLAVLRWFEKTQPGTLIPDGLSLWVAPLINTSGWDAAVRTWGDHDLNRSFTHEAAPDFLKPLMHHLADPLPALYVDLHEDY